jgi:DNA-binding GntR family transcriptional regulator
VKPIPAPESLAELAYRSLRGSILTGELVPGNTYTENGLASTLNMSRTPVREALQRLAGIGLVTYHRGRGILVRKYTEEDARGIFELRQAIEGAVMENLAGGRAQFDSAAAKRMLDAQEEAVNRGDRAEFIVIDRNWHLLLAQCTGNQHLYRVLHQVRDQLEALGLEALARPERVKEVLAEHRAIMAALDQRDVAAAKTAMLDHLRQTLEAVLEQLHRQSRQAREADLVPSTRSA